METLEGKHATRVTVFGPLDQHNRVMRRQFTYVTTEPHAPELAEAMALDHYMSAWGASADRRSGVLA